MFDVLIDHLGVENIFFVFDTIVPINVHAKYSRKNRWNYVLTERDEILY